MVRATGKKSESETALAKAIRDWAEHQDLSKPGNRQYKRRVDALLDTGPDITGVQSAVAELYRRRLHDYKSSDIGMSPRRRECLKHLLEMGMDPSEVDSAGDTLLHQLCRFDAPMADIRLLLGAGAGDVINARNGAGETPLLAHLRSSAPTQGVLLMLLANGANPDIADHDSVTPMMVLQTKSARLPTAEVLADILERHGRERPEGKTAYAR